MPDIEVIIRKGTSADGVSQTEASSSATGEAQVNKKEKGKTSVQQGAINTALLQVGKQMVSQGISQYAELSGDYYTAGALNAVSSIGADVATIAVGGVAGAVAVAGKYALQFATSFVQQARLTQEHQFTVERLGQISTKGSRY